MIEDLLSSSFNVVPVFYVLIILISPLTLKKHISTFNVGTGKEKNLMNGTQPCQYSIKIPLGSFSSAVDRNQHRERARVPELSLQPTQKNPKNKKLTMCHNRTTVVRSWFSFFKKKKKKIWFAFAYISCYETCET